MEGYILSSQHAVSEHTSMCMYVCVVCMCVCMLEGFVVRVEWGGLRSQANMEKQTKSWHYENICIVKPYEFI